MAHLYTAPAEGITTKLKEYDVSGASSATLVEPSIEPGNIIAGVAIDETSGNVYVRSTNTTKIKVYEPREPRVKYPLVVEVEGDGEVTGAGIACTEAGNGGAECEEEFSAGAEVPLAASAAGGSHFVEWKRSKATPAPVPVRPRRAKPA